ncbi:MAG: amidohydrolase [Acidobacteria bacterium]|nr:amidohydrolase [Acidobacteriota bacterium]
MIVLILWLAAACLLQAGSPADVIYINGKIITVSRNKPLAQAIAIRGNKFLAVGSNAEVLRTAGASTRKVDLRGRTVVPGLIESHTHPIKAALSEQQTEIPILHAISDIQDFVRKEAIRLPATELIFVPKVYPSRLKERRYPTRYELDAAAPGRRVMCDNDYASVFSSAVLKEAGVTRDTPQPALGKLIKDEQGEPTGLILSWPELLSRYRKSRPPSHASMVWAIEQMQQRYSAAGITSTSDRAQPPEGFRAYQDVHDRGRMIVRTNVTYYTTAPGTPQDVAAEVRRIPFTTGWGDEWLKVGPLKTTIDGGILIGTAYLREVYGPNTQLYGYVDPNWRGVLAITREKLAAFVRTGTELGWQMTSHAAGSGGADVLLEAYEAVNRDIPINGRRFNLMHANFPNASTIARAAKLGIVFDSQIAWLHCDGDAIKDVFGPERMKDFLPFRSLIDAGIIVVGGSDHMIKFDSHNAINPYHPFYGMWMAITRKTTSGAVLNPEQRITREEALRMWSINGAYDTFEEKIKGSIEPGKLADMVIIDKDYVTCPEDEIRNIQSLETIVDGKTVFKR